MNDTPNPIVIGGHADLAEFVELVLAHVQLEAAPECLILDALYESVDILKLAAHSREGVPLSGVLNAVACKINIAIRLMGASIAEVPK